MTELIIVYWSVHIRFFENGFDDKQREILFYSRFKIILPSIDYSFKFRITHFDYVRYTNLPSVHRVYLETIDFISG